jgi:hypothetical protein
VLEQCAISPEGACVGSSEYETYVNSQAYYIPNYKYYPSSEYSYCASDDARCSQCVAKWSDESSASVSTTDVCTGQDGCICVAACEVTDRVATILNNEGCSDSDSSSSSGSYLTSTERVLVALAVGAAAGLFFYAMVWILRRYMAIVRERELGECYCDGIDHHRVLSNCMACCIPQPLVTRSTRRAPRTGPQLNLNGWKSLQQKLVETERAQLSHEPATAGQHDSTIESAAPEATTVSEPMVAEMPAPAIEEQEEPPVLGTALTAVGGPTVIVERGDAYRPPSPSLMNARRA